MRLGTNKEIGALLERNRDTGCAGILAKRLQKVPIDLSVEMCTKRWRSACGHLQQNESAVRLVHCRADHKCCDPVGLGGEMPTAHNRMPLDAAARRRHPHKIVGMAATSRRFARLTA